MMKKLWIYAALLLLLVACLGLTSCGGNGNKNNSDGETVLVTYYLTEDGSPIKVTVYDGEFNLAKVPQRTGYVFLGLYDAWNGGSQIVDASGNCMVEITHSVTLYAHWSTENYTVLFEGNGVQLPTGKEQLIMPYGGTVTAFPMLEKEGYDFVGWADVNGVLYSDGSTVKSERQLFNAENYSFTDGKTTLYAVFTTKRLTVKFDYNDGSYQVDTLEVDYGTVLTESQFPQKDMGNKCITAWSIYTNGGNAYSGQITADLTLYAVWKTYRPVYLDDTLGNRTMIRVFQNETFDLLNYDGVIRPGYQIDGWYINAIYSGNPVTSLTYGSAQEVYYAKWSIATYTLTFDVNSAGKALEPITYKMGDVFALETLSKEGYTFEGWCTKADCSDTPITSVTVDFYGTHTLYAKFTPYSFTVVLNAEKGSVAQNSAVVQYQTAYTLPVPQRLGSTFLGWFDGTGANAVQYTDGTGHSLRAYPHLNGMTLYAKWSVQTFTVRYETNGGSMVSSQTYEYGDPLSFPTAPTRVGVYFMGWYDSTLSIPYDTNRTVTSTMVLYAKWGDVDMKEAYASASYLPLLATDTTSGATEYNGHYYQIVKGSYSWEDAQTICEELGGHLATITSAQENDFVASLWKQENVATCFIGATDKETEGVWQWVTGEPWSYSNFKPGEPNGGTSSNYALFWTNHGVQWDDTPTAVSFACEWDDIPASMISDTQYKGNYYKVFTGSYTWEQAKYLCEAYGGHLATLTTPGEDKFVYQLCKDAGAYDCFLGATDIALEGVWQWVTGEKWSYSNFHAGEPSSGTAENCLGFYTAHRDGGWNDFSTERKAAFVCEWEPQAAVLAENAIGYVTSNNVLYNGAFYYGGHLYKIYNYSYSYDEAKTYCEKLGGHLVMINDEQENAALYSYIVKNGNYDVAFGMTDRDSEGTWILANGQTITYTNWTSGEPNNSNDEDYAFFTTSGGIGQWNDADWKNCFICEWDYWEK